MPVPRSYGEVVAGRLDACSAPARRLVEAASVLGLHCALGTVTDVADLDAPLEALDEAVAAGLLAWRERGDGRSVSFTHPLARAAVYHGLSAARRVELHTVAAGVMDDEHAALRHRLEATPATDAALAAEAEGFARREGARGAWASAAASLRAASRLSDTSPERERRLLDAIDAMLYAGDGAGARQLAVQTARFAASARRESVLAYLAIYAGDADEAERRLGRAWEMLDPATERELSATVAARRAFVSGLSFRADDVVAWARRALELVPGDAKIEALATTQLAVGLSLQRRRPEAHAALDAGLARAESTGFPLRSIKGALLLGEDDLTEARPVLAAAAAEAQQIGSLVIASQSLALLAKLEFAAGAWDEAVVFAERAVSLALESDEAWAQAFAHWAALHVPAARGEPGAEPAADAPGFERIVEVQACAQAERAAARDAPEAVLRALGPVLRGRTGFWRWQPL